MSNETNSEVSPNEQHPLGEHELHQLQQSLRGMQFGSITLIVQDGYIVQIDRTDKRRLRRSPQSKSKSN